LKVMFAGGGTGGHLYIGIALAHELRRRDATCDFVFVGTRHGLESQIVPQEGFELDFIVSAGLKGMGKLEFLHNLSLIPRSLWQSRRVIRNHAPAVVVGVGGYASGPIVLAAWWLGKPTLVVEPNAQPGLTNRILSRVVDRAALAMPDKDKYFGHKGSVTGIPVREEFIHISTSGRNPGHLRVLIFGGSQGSRVLNSAVCRALPKLKELGDRLHLTHQTGDKDFESVRRAYSDAGLLGDVRAFLPKIYQEMAQADLVVCRAGAGTIAEITTAGKAAILVPFARAADDHQTKNAQALEQCGAAKTIPEEELEPTRLAEEFKYFADHHEVIHRMEKASRKLAKPAAARRIADLIVSLTGRGKNYYQKTDQSDGAHV
jgi:UDP-N-acetylglucosamine--N-acetylmuramyl-(pentapeptide) pyrophosphoryl-undecaprenol N-acetylglucosamine transferase